MIFKLPINSTSWLSTLVRWGAELRNSNLISANELKENTWEPQYAGSGTLTFTGVTTEYATYITLPLSVGQLVFIWIRATGTTAGVGANIAFSLPILPLKDTPRTESFSSLVIDGGARIGSWSTIDVVSSLGIAGIVARYDSANFGAGTNRLFAVSGFYIGGLV